LLTLPRTERRSLIVSVVGLDPPALEAGDAAVILYLLDPEQDVSLLLAPACHIYHLTATEARLVARLVSGADLADAAASLNLAVQTARSYLKQIFLKTGTNRQAELVRIMCGSVARATLGGEFSRCVSRV
jgi:DNA-binding CsgD family transcriptional regulator